MKKKNILKKTISKIMGAYLDGKLNKDNCQGDPLTAVLGDNSWGAVFRTITLDGDYTQMKKQELLHKVTRFGSKEQINFIIRHQLDGKELIESSPYTMYELMEMEYAYQTTPDENSDVDFNIFNSVMSVVDVLFDIHEVNEEQRPQFYGLLKQE